MTAPRDHGPSIWWWAFGYFAVYTPYAALTKVVTSGLIPTGGKPPSGVELLPASVMATVVTSIAFLVATGWWRHAVKDVRGMRLPLPTRFTLLSGLCSSGIIATTTLAYTFDKVSIVFVMLLMRGGLLILAPVVDAITGRSIKWFSIAALAMSIAALATSMLDPKASTELTWLCGIDIALYLSFYFVRLQLMSKKAKSQDPRDNLRYFVEEQLVSAPALLLALAGWALLAPGAFADQLRAGFTTFFDRPVAIHGLLIGVLSQGTGIFGGLILLDRRENTFSVPVNRASSVLAGVLGTMGIWWLLTPDKPPRTLELVGAGIMIGAILVLTFGAAYDKRRAAR